MKDISRAGNSKNIKYLQEIGNVFIDFSGKLLECNCKATSVQALESVDWVTSKSPYLII